MYVGSTSMLFTNCHLPAHSKHWRRRNGDIRRILGDGGIVRFEPGQMVHNVFDRVFVLGNLNFGLGGTQAHIESLIAQGDLQALLSQDQLKRQLQGESLDRDRGDKRHWQRTAKDTVSSFPAPDHIWHEFQEGPIEFPPLWSGEEQAREGVAPPARRTAPAWTDRILWRRALPDEVHQVAYDSVKKLRSPHHRAVFGQFEVGVDVDSGLPPDLNAPRSRGCCVQ